MASAGGGDAGAGGNGAVATGGAGAAGVARVDTGKIEIGPPGDGWPSVSVQRPPRSRQPVPFSVFGAPPGTSVVRV